MNTKSEALPVLIEDSRYAVISIGDAAAGIRCGFRTRTQFFGSAAAVLRNNCLSRITDSLIFRLMITPTLGYLVVFWIPHPICG